MSYGCPLEGCTAAFGTKGSVKAHITRKQDTVHKGESGPDYDSEIRPVDVDVGADRDDQADDQEGGADATSSSDAGVVPPEHWVDRLPDDADDADDADDTDDTGPECCGSPALEGSAGDRYELGNGAVIQLETGDEICTNCEAIHE